MDIKQRFQTAFKEDANVLGLAGATALSLMLFNPLPLLIGFVAEVAYLLYIPDSRWYETRLARRFDAEIVTRRKALQKELFPALPEPVQAQFQNLEALRDALVPVTVEATTERRWFEFMRQIDYLLEVSLQLYAKQAKFPLQLALPAGSDPEAGALEFPDLEERKRLLVHYENETEAMNRLVNLQKDTQRQAILTRSVRDLERETDTVRKELWQMLEAQQLLDSLRQTIQEIDRLLCDLPERLQQGEATVESLYSTAYQLVQGAERLSRHQNDWLKETTSSLARK